MSIDCLKYVDNIPPASITKDESSEMNGLYLKTIQPTFNATTNPSKAPKIWPYSPVKGG
jgi:hypothetical protein